MRKSTLFLFIGIIAALFILTSKAIGAPSVPSAPSSPDIPSPPAPPSSSSAPSSPRAFFEVLSPDVLAEIDDYLVHDFGNNIVSLEADLAVLENLKSNSALSYQGAVTKWEFARHRRRRTPRLRRNRCSPQQEIPWGVGRVGGGEGGNGIRVAVVDSGVYTRNPDLKDQIVDCVDTRSRRIRSSCYDSVGHGTHVAGIVAANGKLKGVAPGARIMAIRACSSWCWSDDVARGIYYAANNGANIINLSLGGWYMGSIEKWAIDYAVEKGVLVVAAAGNAGSYGEDSILYPAAYEKVVAVGAIDSTDAVPDWSSRGNNYKTTPYVVEERDIEVVAPGVNIESTWKSRSKCYKTLSGTSMATPHVAGLAAKYWAGTSHTTRVVLQQFATAGPDLGDFGDDPLAGFGIPVD